jgi:hypothetical protein
MVRERPPKHVMIPSLLFHLRPLTTSVVFDVQVTIEVVQLLSGVYTRFIQHMKDHNTFKI